MKKIISLIFFLFISISMSAQSWSAVGVGVNEPVSALAVYNGELYAGGQFGVLKWNGSAFDTLPGNYQLGNFTVWSLAVFDNELYAAGRNPQLDNIRRWNGSSWNSVGAGLNNDVYALAVYNGSLFAGGIFTYSNLFSGHIMRWDGNDWWQLGNNGIDLQGSKVHALAVYENELYVAGNFVSIEGDTNLSGIARWNSSIWNSVGPKGINGVVSSLGIFGNELYAGGPYFTLAGGVAVNELAKWNGTIWNSVGSGVKDANAEEGNISSFAEYHNELYAGGIFLTLDQDTIKSIARYNGATWIPVGSGVDSTGIPIDTIIWYGSDTTLYFPPHEINAFIEFNDELYAGGSFNMIGGVVAHNIAKWSTPVGMQEVSSDLSISVYPNPVDKNASLNFQSPIESLTLFSTDGKLLQQLNHLHQSKLDLDVSALSSGMYFIEASSNNKIYRGKILVSH